MSGGLALALPFGFVLGGPVPAPEELRVATLPAVAGLVGAVAAGWSEHLWRRPAGPRRLAAAPGGRSVGRHWATGSAAAGPYPGWAYGLPIATALAALALATWWALLTAAGLAFFAGFSLARLAQNLRMGQPGAPAGQAPWDWTQNAGFALIALGVLSGFVALQSLLWQSPAIPRAESHSGAAREVSA